MYAQLKFKTVDIYKNTEYSNIKSDKHIRKTTLEQIESVFDNSTHVLKFQYKINELLEVTIPNCKITYDDDLFQCCHFLKKVKLSNNTQAISDRMFNDCRSLITVEIPDSVYEIGSGAFACCESLECITLPDTVARIGANAFANCKNLKSITFKGKVYTDKKEFNMMLINDGITEHNGFDFPWI